MPALLGVGVLVTRPEQQAAPLCRLLEAEGATTLRLPAIDIHGLGSRREHAAHAGPLEGYDTIVFTSANAVRFGAPLLDQKRDLTLAAIGAATARALNQAGYRVAIQPAEGSDSEALLAQVAFEHAAGKRVLIVTGSGGRGHLQQELGRRGAEVRVLEVYCRLPSTPDPQRLAGLLEQFAEGNVQVITATSVQIGEQLLHLAAPPLRALFERAHWLVPGPRVADRLRRLGLSAPLIVAASAEDHDLLAALGAWRAAESGA